jgi:hypothetical protein
VIVYTPTEVFFCENEGKITTFFLANNQNVVSLRRKNHLIKMYMNKKDTINVQGTEVTLLSKHDGRSYICITDIARYKNFIEPKDVVKNWMRSRSTIEFLGLWEKIHNPNFKGVEFDPFLFEAGSNAFTMSPTKWIEATNAIGIFTKAGVGGGTFAHQDIAFEFASWVSSEFHLSGCKPICQRAKLMISG